MKISEEQWKLFVNDCPIYAIDIILFNNEKGIIVGQRINNPAKDKYFVPGGRIYKNETRKNAFKRICNDEIGINLELENTSLIGIYEHFYQNSRWDKEDINTHYIVEARFLKIDSTLIKKANLNSQHSKTLWLKSYEDNKDKLHHYCEPYFKYEHN